MKRSDYCRVTLVVATLLGLSHGEALSRFIRHYEPLHYDQEELMYHHTRVRRSVVGPNDVSLQFSAFGRYFDLSLKPEKKIFHPNFTLTIDNRVVRDHPLKSYIYTGVDRDDPSVKVHGNVIHGVFEGTIHTSQEDYHVEPAHRYLNDSSIHSVIYRGSDLDLSSVNGAGCGSKSEEVQEELTRIQMIHGLGEQRRLRKRQATRDPTKVRCWLNVIGDYRYVQSVGGVSIAMVQLINIIQQASEIYETTNFDRMGAADMIHFGILNLDVESSPPNPSSPFAQEFLGVQSYLDFHSRADYSDYCLSYRFTNRDFDDGVVGLAYIAPQPGVNSAGGICDRPATRNGILSTLNTGIVTNLNYGSMIPPRISALTFAHEAGHNFGSDHDTAEPDPNDGAFIMYAFATDGSRPNNNRFSPRSIDERMFPVIADAGQNPDTGCFVAADDLCGNRLLDENEECDCGGQSQWFSNGTCMNDLCCNGTSCTLVSTAQCSVDQGPCCNGETCMYLDTSEMCSEQTECAMEQQCNGTSASCPPPEPREVPENETALFCNDNENVCATDGTCTGSICLALNLTQCECLAPEKACDLCCRLQNETCVSTFYLATTPMASLLPDGEGRRLQIGFPCKNFSGYCDFLNQCMVVDNDGALNRLVDFFLNSQGFQQAIEWITRMWWVVLIVVVALLVIMFVVVLIFHVILPRPKHRRRREGGKKRKARTVPLQNYPGGSQGPYYNYK